MAAWRIAIAVAVLAAALPGNARGAALPGSMAVLGDSIARGWGSSGALADNLAGSWATGTDAAVNSHYSRLLARTVAISGQAGNDAVVSATMNDTFNQAASAITQGAQYVAIMAGTNDVCTGTTAQMTSVSAFSTQLSATLNRLTSSLPGVRTFVASIPNWVALHDTFAGNPTAVSAWIANNRCPDVLGSSSTAAGRAVVAQRIADLNAAIASVCAGVAGCTSDGGAVYNLAFTAADLSADFFHLSEAGQGKVAAATWQATPFAQPPTLTGFAAGPGGQAVSLRWTLPPDVARVRIVEKVGSAPTSPTDGTVVLDGAGTVGGTTVTALTAGTTYFFGAWTYDVDSVQAGPVVVSATPTSVGAPPTQTALPTVTGSAQVGQTLTATPGSWAGTPTGFAFQWRRCDVDGVGCVDVSGATGATYAVAAADVGARLRVRVTATNAGGSSVADSAATATAISASGGAYNSLFADPGCTAVVLPDGTLRATILGGADSVDSAYGTIDFGGQSGLTGGVFIRDLVGLAAGQVLNGNLAVLQMRDASNALVYELYVAPDRTLRLWSPDGGLTATSINLSTGDVVPNDGTSSIRVEVSALRNSSITVRMNGVDRIALTLGGGATTGNQRYLRVGIDHYDTNTTTETVSAQHASVATSQSGWLGPPATSPPANTVPPAITGAAQQGQTLNATTGTWSNSPTSFAYQWQRCDSGGANCVDIGSASAASYVVAAADVGNTLRVRVTATNGAGSTTAASAVTAVVTAPPVNTVPPAINGVAQLGQTLTASTGTWSNGPTSFADQWQRCDSGGASCADIASASASSYVVAAADVGSTLRVRVTATNAAGSATAASAVTAVVTAPPVNTVPPAISGIAQQGQTLSASTGTWSNSPTSFAYQWQRCDSSGASCGDIGSATASTYVAAAADVGSTLRVRVTATNAAGSATAPSAVTAVVATPPQPPSNTVPPAISGIAQQGQTLTASTGTWSNGPTSFAYQWQRCDSGGASCADIASATTSSYVVAAADVGSTLRVGVTATNTAGSATAPSAVTAVVTALPPPANTAPPTISGNAQQGQTLSASTGTWSNGPTSFAYQWQRCGGSCADIAGATAATYVAGSADVGSTLRVGVTATNAGGTSAAAFSAVTAVVTGPPPAPLQYETSTSFGVYGTGDSQSFTVPVAPNELLLFSFAGKSGGDSVTGVSYGGLPLTRLVARGQGSVRVELWYLLGPPTGSNTLSWTKSGASQNSTWAAAVYSGVDQTTPFGAPAQTGVTQDGVRNAKTLAVTSASGDLVVDTAVFNGGSTTTGPAAGAAQIVRWSRNLSTTQGGSSTAPGGTASISWTPSGSPVYDWAIVAAALHPSTPIGPPPPPPANTSPPTISGTPQQGQMLTASPGSWSNSPTSFAYQWQRCGGSCADIAGATSATYVAGSADVGSTLRVGVSATNAGGTSAPAFSAATATVAPGASAPLQHESSASFGAYGTGDSQSFTVPTAPSELLLFSFAGKSGSDSISSVTYGGRALTVLGARSQGSVRVELWYLLAPPTGSNTLTWSKTGANQNVTWGVSVYSGVDQSTPFGALAQGGATQDGVRNAKTVPVTSSSGDLVVDTAVFNGGATSAGPAAGAAQTTRWSRNLSTTQGGSSTQPGGAGTTSSWTPSGSPQYDWAILAAALHPAP